MPINSRPIDENISPDQRQKCQWYEDVMLQFLALCTRYLGPNYTREMCEQFRKRGEERDFQRPLLKFSRQPVCTTEDLPEDVTELSEADLMKAAVQTVTLCYQSKLSQPQEAPKRRTIMQRGVVSLLGGLLVGSAGYAMYDMGVDEQQAIVRKRDDMQQKQGLNNAQLNQIAFEERESQNTQVLGLFFTGIGLGAVLSGGGVALYQYARMQRLGREGLVQEVNQVSGSSEETQKMVQDALPYLWRDIDLSLDQAKVDEEYSIKPRLGAGRS